ncbi:MAG TPA: hypothetical protein VNM69_03820 [Bacillus sp. (in: firmicutes)]|nr:hypothetical protein [Bacillus sp. (in: firmicutes)]
MKLRLLKKRNFKKAFVSLLVLLILSSPFLYKVENVEAQCGLPYSKQTCDLSQQYGFPLKNSDNYSLNENLLLTQGIVVYGSWSDVPGNDLKSGQRRYLGWSVDGNKYTNFKFPHDEDVTKSIDKNWIYQPWNKAEGINKGIETPSYFSPFTPPETIKQIKGYLEKMLDPYDPANAKNPPTGKKWLESYNQLNNFDWTTDDLLNFVLINTYPSDFGQGYVTMYSEDSNGKWWYQTFIIPPLKPIDTGGGLVPPTTELEECKDLCDDSERKTTSVVKVVCSPEGGCTYYYDHLDVQVNTLSPSQVKAGYGFDLKVHTSYTNEYYGPSSWKGPTKVVAYFPQADSFLPTEVELEPLKSAGSWENDWVLPKVWVEKFSGNMFYDKNDVNRDSTDTLLDGGNKWYTPFKRKDGAYNFKIVAYYAGKNNLKDCTSQCVIIKGSPFEEHVVRSVLPDNPFPTGVTGYNWQGFEDLIHNLSDWFYQKETNDTILNPKDFEDQWVN